MPDDLQGRILRVLASVSYPIGVTSIYLRLYSAPQDLREEAQRTGAIHSALLTMKSQHRVWSDDGRSWRITERGRRV